MWLLNHTSARKFELGMLKNLGFNEIFLPKSFPQEIGFRSGSIDRSEDANLTIPADDLALLNGVDWYGNPGRDIWQVANKHFDLLFFILNDPSFLRAVSRHFKGAAVLRAFGRENMAPYGDVINWMNSGKRTLESMGRRFWLGTAYEHLADVEDQWLRSREVFLPVGMNDCQLRDCWIGTDARIFFVCPDIEGIAYYSTIYREFRAQFGDLPYAIAGVQALATKDPNVLGYLPELEHQRNMREFRVMFYHSTELNHVHYHPFEAVRAGMPLVFMAGGMIDKLGGSKLPGRCRTTSEARAKLRRILDGDRELIERIRASQPVLLEKMHSPALEPTWREGISQVLDELERSRVARPTPVRRPKVAIIVPLPYRGGTLRSAKLVADALWKGSREHGEDADIVFAYPVEESELSGRELDRWDMDLPSYISPRRLGWQKLDRETAIRSMKYAGHTHWSPIASEYMIPDDRRENFCDCDLWIVISDRLSSPLLPIRSYLMLVYDYVQRYDPKFVDGSDHAFLEAARRAERVLVTTKFTEQDALSYAGVLRENLFRVPTLAPQFQQVTNSSAKEKRPYFLWPTNLGHHKNHANAICALREYYEVLDGRLDCQVTGVESELLLRGGVPGLEALTHSTGKNSKLDKRLRILGELSDTSYRKALSGAVFLWHPATIDNGTLAVIEAAMVGVPALSSTYPAMEELNTQFELCLRWMDAKQPSEMARQLKWMEEHLDHARAGLPSRLILDRSSVEHNAAAYWRVVRECL